MLKDINIVLGVTGGIAAYKAIELTRMLKKQNANVYPVLTKNAANFITPLTLSTIAQKKCLTEMFNTDIDYNIEHISYAKLADVIAVVPATANVISKIANGIADDILTTILLASDPKKIIIAPAMNTNMINNPILQNNFKKLKKYNISILDTEAGMLACGDEGYGKLISLNHIYDSILYKATKKKDLIDKNILVTAGPTVEKIDSVRYITNYSSGKMGYNIAKAAMLRGANVTLITGPTELDNIYNVNTINISSAKEMLIAIKQTYRKNDIIIKSAAVSDYTPKNKVYYKIKKSDQNINLELEATTDILKFIGQNKNINQFLCGFSMETQNLIENSRKKLHSKNLDMIVANNLNDPGSGFQTNTNKASLITLDEVIQLDLITKFELSNIILNKILSMLKRR